MSSSERKLSECIEIRRQFLRSVNLEKDYQNNSQNGDYIITPTARQILRRVAEGLTERSTYRAWTITGPYGVGKSAFAVFLTKVLCRGVTGSDAAHRHLSEVDQPLATALAQKTSNGKGLLPVAITARRAPASLCLAEGIRDSAGQIKASLSRPIISECQSLIKDVRKGTVADSRRIVSLLSQFATAASNSGHSGLLFMIDELGKLFEFAARMPQKADVFVLQELAEQSCRSGAFPTLFLGFLHQSFEEYGQHLDSSTRKEWAKIHGRFEDVVFLEPPDQVVRMVAAAIKWTGAPMSVDALKQVSHVAKICADNGVCPLGMRKSEFEEICQQTYPLHPTTLVALPFIFRKFAQNERSLFSYLSSLEPGGFQDYLRAHCLLHDKPAFLRLGQLFDYFTINFGSGLFRQPQARRWMEAADVLDRKENLTALHGDLIKTIGVLGALGEFSPLSATETMIAVSLGDTAKMPADLAEGIQFLGQQSILTHRRFNKTYRIWEGSDVDIEERVAEGERQLRGTIKLATSIQQYLESRPIVARRHSFQTGSLRYFSTAYLDDPANAPNHLSPAKGAAGQVLVCLSPSPSALQAFRDLAASADPERRDIVFAIPQQFREIQSAVAELAALRWAWDNTQELRDDRVARREIALRISESEHFLRRTLNALLDPREEPLGSECLWYWTGKLQPMHSRVDVSHLLSTICDSVYDKTPHVRNELVIRRALSSAAAAARRDLIERMLIHSEAPSLGIEGYPPERSIYESVLKDTGIHVETSGGKWTFVDPPERKRHGMCHVWEHLRTIIFEAEGDPCQVNTVFGILADPPYGVMDGIHPVLLCAFMMAHRDETTLYREGTFIPDPSVADFEILMRRPELFAVGGIRLAGARAAVVERLAKGLGAAPATVPVVRAMFKMVKGLPEFAWSTKQLSDNTVRMREAFQKAKSPERFLFNDLPTALGLAPFPEAKPEKSDIEVFFTALNGALNEWSGIAASTYAEAEAQLLKACGLEPGDGGWQKLRGIAAKLESRENDPLVLQFLRRIVQTSCDKEGVLSILALVVNRPPANWLDADVERFPGLAKALGDPIKRAMVRAGFTSESHDAMAALAPDQRERAKSLARELAKKLDPSQQRNTPEIVRAALLLLVDDLPKGTGGRK
ncbi:MAG: hypothetical protein PHW60_12795 [Kiritimatiellae bacterium]|nr:hypothetical protein [Kiritimatiellia bacterium]